jgi:hypothetical protein
MECLQVMPTTGHQEHRAGSAMCMGCQHVRKRVSERDLNPMAVTCGVARLPRSGKQITAGQRVAYVSEDQGLPIGHSTIALTRTFVLGGAR